MPMIDAQRFLRSIPTDEYLRGQLNIAATRKEIVSVLKEACLDFSPFEMDEAYRALLVKCQTMDQAMRLKEVKNWWDLLILLTPEE